MLAPFDKTAYRAQVLIRCAEEGERPGPFAAFGLPLDDPFPTDDELAMRIRAVKLFWKKEKQNTKISGLIKTLEKQAPQLEVILRDPLEREKARQQEAQGSAEDARRHDERRIRIEKRLRLIAEAGRGISPEEHARLSKLVGDAARFEAMLAELGVRLEELAADEDAYDRAHRERIRKGLATYAGLSQEHVSDGPVRSFPSLYAYLREFDPSVPPDGTSPSPGQIRLAVGLAKEYAAKLPHNDLRSAMDNLNSEAELLLQRQASYDAGRRVDFREALEEQLAIDFAPGDVIDRTTVEQLCAGAGRHGLAAADATDVVRRAASDARIQVQGDQLGTPVRFVLCSACNESMVDRGQQDCSNCGEALYRDCPACGTRALAASAACPNCRLNLLARARAEALVEEATTLLEAHRPGAAMDPARRAARADPQFEHAAEVQARVKQAVDHAHRLWDQAQAALRARRLNEAEVHLSEIARIARDVVAEDGMTFAQATDRVRGGIEQGRCLLADAESASGATAERDYVAALAAVADLEPARRALAVRPPEPPSAPTATLVASGVHLQWTASPSPGELDYLVVRSRDRPPRAPSDGTEIARTGLLACDDTRVEPGAVAAWAIFALRAGAYSVPAVTARLVVAPAVREARARGDDGEVELSWDPDLGSGSLGVVRQTPNERPAVVPVEPARGRHLDLDLENGTTYTYVFSVSYPQPGGAREAGPEVTVRARPLPRPRPILDGRVKPCDAGLRFVAPAPAEGSARVLRLTSLDCLPAHGSEVAADSLQGLGAEIPYDGNGWLDSSPPTVAWYLPVTIVGDRAAIGAAVRHVEAPPVEALEVTDCRSELHLTWRWPPDTSEAVVLVRGDEPPTGVDDPCAVSLKVDRAVIAQGGCVLPVSEEGDLHVAVLAAVRVGGERLYGTPSEGARRTLSRGGEQGEIHYHVGTTRRWRQRKLTVVAEGPLALPDLVLVHHGSVLPLARQSAERELGRLSGGQPKLELENGAIPDHGYVRAFLASDADAHRYRLVHPPSHTCRLS